MARDRAPPSAILLSTRLAMGRRSPEVGRPERSVTGRILAVDRRELSTAGVLRCLSIVRNEQGNGHPPA